MYICMYIYYDSHKTFQHDFDKNIENFAMRFYSLRSSNIFQILGMRCQIKSHVILIKFVWVFVT